MYCVYMINFGYYLDTEFKTLKEAEFAGKKTGFEFVVHKRNAGGSYGFA